MLSKETIHIKGYETNVSLYIIRKNGQNNI